MAAAEAGPSRAFARKWRENPTLRRGHVEPVKRDALTGSSWPSIGRETPSARPARKTSLFGTPADADRDEKARSVVALSRDPPRRAEFAGSPPAAGFFLALGWPLVQLDATDAQPQARAIWASGYIGQAPADAREKLPQPPFFPHRVEKPETHERKVIRAFAPAAAATACRSPKRPLPARDSWPLP
jgi:hypothetical protein